MTTRYTIDHDAAWAALYVSGCVTSPDVDPSFRFHFPECLEYRFPYGTLGFGGKIWFSPGAMLRPGVQAVTVDCYSEDVTPERQERIDAANERLRRIAVRKEAA